MKARTLAAWARLAGEAQEAAGPAETVSVEALLVVEERLEEESRADERRS